MARDAARHSGRLIQERAKETHGAELDGKPAHVIPTLGRAFAIGVVEVEVPCKLVRARFACIPAISALLFCRL